MENNGTDTNAKSIPFSPNSSTEKRINFLNSKWKDYADFSNMKTLEEGHT